VESQRYQRRLCPHDTTKRKRTAGDRCVSRTRLSPCCCASHAFTVEPRRPAPEPVTVVLHLHRAREMSHRRAAIPSPLLIASHRRLHAEIVTRRYATDVFFRCVEALDVLASSTATVACSNATATRAAADFAKTPRMLLQSSVGRHLSRLPPYAPRARSEARGERSESRRSDGRTCPQRTDSCGAVARRYPLRRPLACHRPPVKQSSKDLKQRPGMPPAGSAASRALH
jgi:hypothetical protein